MALNYTIVADGKRHTVHAKPLELLASLVQQIAGYDQPGVQLLHNGRPLDLQLPARLANLPSGAKLELITEGQPSRRIGLQDRQPAVANSPAPSSIPQRSTGPPAEQTHAQPQQQQAAAQAPDRQLHVFSEQQLLEAQGAAAAPRSTGELPDEFFEFTPDDFQAVQAGYARQRASQGGPLLTRRLREQDEARRAAAMGPVPVRLHLPGGLILQAQFGAGESIGVLYAILASCLADSLPPWKLYTRPPKQVLNDHQQTLLRAGLVPAANVHLAFHQDMPPDRPLLRPAVAALQQAGPPAIGRGGKASAEPAAADEATTEPALAQKKPKGAPKWFKR